MPVGDIFKVSRKTFINPRAWIGWDSLRTYNTLIFGILKNAFTPSEPTRKETFADAMQRMHLTEEDIQTNARNYLLYTTFFMICGALVFFFGFYLIFKYHTLHGWLLAMSASALFFGQAFRFHFWYFQIKQRKLGCTFQEWRDALFNKQGGAS
jgi:intracellular multiplication protein IcmV